MPVLQSEDLLRQFDGTQPPDYAVGDIVERHDITTGTASNEFMVTGIYPPGTRPPGSFTRHPHVWYTQVQYRDNRRTPFGLPLWIACRLQKCGTPRPVPKTMHKIGVPKNKLP